VPSRATERRAWELPVCERISGRTIVNARRAVSAPARKPGCQRVVAFHTALYRLSGNRAIEDTVAAQWPHLKRSMGAMLNGPEQRPLVWAEHREILRLVLSITSRGGGLFTANVTIMRQRSK
jgi:DNA-binding FadR family transcriptional regulator